MSPARSQSGISGSPDRTAFLEARHRHAGVKVCLGCGKATGLDPFPLDSLSINAAWCVAATIAADLLAWLRLLCLDRSLAQAETKTLHYRNLHTSVRIVRGQHRRKINPADLPWARELKAAFRAAFALAPT